MNGNGATGDDACHLRLTADGNVGESNGEDVEILLVMIVLMVMMVMMIIDGDGHDDDGDDEPDDGYGSVT